MAAQKQEKHRVKMKNTHNYRRKIKRKTIKSNKIKIRIHYTHPFQR